MPELIFLQSISTGVETWKAKKRFSLRGCFAAVAAIGDQPPSSRSLV